jgi:hypothetical protein
MSRKSYAHLCWTLRAVCRLTIHKDRKGEWVVMSSKVSWQLKSFVFKRDRISYHPEMSRTRNKLLCFERKSKNTAALGRLSAWSTRLRSDKPRFRRLATFARCQCFHILCLTGGLVKASRDGKRAWTGFDFLNLSADCQSANKNDEKTGSIWVNLMDGGA